MTADAAIFAGISREPLYSPGKVRADQDIFDATVAALAERGISSRVLAPERAAEAGGADLVFAMCQGPSALESLRLLARRGLPVVHRPEAIEACHRVRLVEACAAAGVARPDYRIVATAEPPGDLDAWLERQVGGVWVKRGDVHATEPGDVVHAESAAEVRGALASLARRGLSRAVLEEHVDGRAIKFYGVRGSGFFRAYEAGGGEVNACGHDGWPALCDSAACCLGLDIYGGDLIVTATGRAVVVDVNDWPSFASCCEQAASAIADRLIVRCREHGGGAGASEQGK